MQKDNLKNENPTDANNVLCNSYKKAIVRYIPMQGYMAQMIEEEELRMVMIKSNRPLYRGQEIQGTEIDGFFIISS